MIALVLNILSAVAFGHVMKWATHRRANLLWVGAWNYIGATCICGIIAVLGHASHHILFTVLTGAWGGVCYLLSLLYYFAAVKRLGMGLATSAIRIAVALPVAAAIVVWHERLHPAQAAGLLLVALAVPLLGSGNVGTIRGSAALICGLLLPLLLVTGLGQLANRIYNSGAPAANAFLFLTCLFAGAGLSALVALAIRPAPLHRQDVLLGLLLGAVNATTNVFLLTALRALPSAEVFSISSAGSVLLATITGSLFWRERLKRSAMGGIGLATVAVVLLTR